jgi:hypothetical protein
MARESAASLSVLPVQALARIEPPVGLDPGEVALFEAVVDSKPAEWFGPDSAPLLVEYVRAKAMCDLLDQQVKAAISGGGDGGDDPMAAALIGAKLIEHYLKLRHTESVRMLQIATKLRLTQQSRYTPQAAATAQKNAPTGQKLWHRPSASRP